MAIRPNENMEKRREIALNQQCRRLVVYSQYSKAELVRNGFDPGKILIHVPIRCERTESPVSLSAAHSVFELSHHLVFSTRYRAGIFDSEIGAALGQYWLAVASKRGFAVDQISILPDHVHLIVSIVPKMSIEECALALLNNGQFYIGKHFPETLIKAGVARLWQDSSYAGTSGQVTTAMVKSFLGQAE